MVPEISNTTDALARHVDPEDKGGRKSRPPTPHPAAPLRPSGAGWYLYSPAELEAIVG